MSCWQGRRKFVANFRLAPLVLAVLTRLFKKNREQVVREKGFRGGSGGFRLLLAVDRLAPAVEGLFQFHRQAHADCAEQAPALGVQGEGGGVEQLLQRCPIGEGQLHQQQ